MCPVNKNYKPPKNRIKILTKEANKIVNGPYYCPNCRKEQLKILASTDKRDVFVACVCGLEEQLSFAPVFQPIDYYSKFMDDYRKKLYKR